MRKLLPFAVLILLSLIFRLILVPLGYHIDIFSNAGWGQWLYFNDAHSFYRNNVWTYSWPTQPPLVNLLYMFAYWLYDQKLLWFISYVAAVIDHHQIFLQAFGWLFNFKAWFLALYAETPFPNGFLITIKLLPVLADLLIAYLLYSIARSINAKRSWLYPLIYLISPFSWYLSALWGQYDQLGFLFLLASVVLIIHKKLLWVPLLIAISIAIKPTALLFVPLLSFVYFQQRPKILTFIFGLATVLGLFIMTTTPFADRELISFTQKVLYPIIFEKAEPRVSTNAFNFWHIITGNQAHNEWWPFLFIPAKVWGLSVFALLHVLVFKKLKINQPAAIWKACFVIGFGGWLFLTNMLERYAFAGLIFGLIVCLYQPKLLKYWLILSVVFMLNLYHGWWFPNQLEGLKIILQWQNGIVTQGLSLISTGIFVVLARQIFKRSDNS